MMGEHEILKNSNLQILWNNFFATEPK